MQRVRDHVILSPKLLSPSNPLLRVREPAEEEVGKNIEPERMENTEQTRPFKPTRSMRAHMNSQ